MGNTRDAKITRSVRLTAERWAVVDAFRDERGLKSDGETIDIILTQWEAYRAFFARGSKNQRTPS